MINPARRVFLSTYFATFDQTPESFSSCESKCGILGQKIQRPKSTNNAGNSVNIVITAETTPIAPTGPRDLLASSSERIKTNNPTDTVAPDATIGSNTPRNAFLIALNLDSTK